MMKMVDGRNAEEISISGKQQTGVLIAGKFVTAIVTHASKVLEVINSSNVISQLEGSPIPLSHYMIVSIQISW